jgi:DNA-binding NarL/FixJ family response regulator
MKHASLAVIDSYVLIRYAFSLQLGIMGFDIVIEAKDGEDFMNQINGCACVPELCILDIDTPSIEEFVTAKRIKAQYPGMKILAYTLYEKEYREINEFGIDFFIKKNCSLEELRSNIVALIQP